ncbi:hypothetical protein IWW51_006263, partial [Coemansia sp. RSA 2702]
ELLQEGVDVFHHHCCDRCRVQHWLQLDVRQILGQEDCRHKVGGYQGPLRREL